MKILAISALHPPDHSGGYGLRIKDIMDRLAARGHKICVMTTLHDKRLLWKDRRSSYPVIRKLHNRYKAKFFPKEVLFDLLDTAAVERQIRRFQPDIIYLGHIYILSKAILPFLARVGLPVLLDEGGASLKGAWTERGRWFRFIEDYGEQHAVVRSLKPFFINLIEKLSQERISRDWHLPENMPIIINSQSNLKRLRALGIPLRNAAVVHSGIDLDTFTFQVCKSLIEPISILCPGRLEVRKGMMDAVHLLMQLLDAGIDARIIFAGATGSESYQQLLFNEIISAGVQNKAVFHGMVPQSKLIDLYHESDICFFSSYQEMGFSRTPLEAMACGSVVISYGYEGSNEIISNGQNGFLVKEGDVDSAMQIIQNLMADTSRITEVREAARCFVEDNHTLNSYVDRIEQVIWVTINAFRSLNQDVAD